MPSYRENPLIIKCSMLCPGISQNTKHHHLTLYKGQVWEEKPYLELCNHNVLNIAYSKWSANFGEFFEKNGELHVPPVPGFGFIRSNTMIPWDNEILQSFAELTNITNMTFHKIERSEVSLEDVNQIQVGNWKCNVRVGHHRQCVPPTKYIAWYIWTKEGLKIQIKVFRFKIIISLISIF